MIKAIVDEVDNLHIIIVYILYIYNIICLICVIKLYLNFILKNKNLYQNYFTGSIYNLYVFIKTAQMSLL